MRFIKRLIALASSAAVCFFIPLFSADVCFDDGESRVFYCGSSSADCREVKADGFAALKGLLLGDICGESAEYDELDLNDFLARYNAEILFCEELSDSVNYYCSAELPYSVRLYGQTVNLHICVKKSGVKVASPIIFGGY